MPNLSALLLILGILFSQTCLWAAETSPESRSTSWEDSEDLKYVESPRTAGLDIQYSPITYEKFNYGSTTSTKNGNGGFLTLEWIPIKNYGKVGLGVGAGFSLITDADVGGGAYATLYVFPIQGLITYQFDYMENQFLVPYVKFGPSMAILMQKSDTGGGRSPINPYYGFDYGAGLQLCLNNLEPSAARALDSSTGINATYLTFEVLYSSNLRGSGVDPDLSRREIRAGMRFEM